MSTSKRAGVSGSADGGHAEVGDRHLAGLVDLHEHGRRLPGLDPLGLRAARGERQLDRGAADRPARR